MPSDEMVEKVAGIIRKRVRQRIEQDWDGMVYALDGVEDAAREIAALTAAMGESKAEPVELRDHAIVLEKDGDGWLASAPDLPGCIATGDTPHAALNSLHDTMASCLAVCDERGIAVPAPTFSVAHPSREDVVEECAKVADAQAEEDEGHRKHAATNGAEGDASHYLWCVHTAKSIAAAIRSLKERS